MQERVLENWLDNANERAFQIPFSQSLAAEGYKILHVSRHCSMELGKDILAIAPDGTPCAYQLKGVKGKQLTLSEWRDDLERQLLPLVCHAIVHPSMPSHPHHQAYIVINGMFAEEVSHSIDLFNRALPAPYPKLKTIVKGELFARFRNLGSDFWPQEISVGFRTMLELVLSDPRGLLNKAKISHLLDIVLRFNEPIEPETKRKHCARLASASALISYAISAFQNAENNVAEFEALTILFAYQLAYIRRTSLDAPSAGQLIEVTAKSMLNCLGRLCDELIEDENIKRGEPLTDRFVYRERLNWIIGLLALYGLWGRRTEIPELHLTFVREFLRKNVREMRLTREGVAPYFFLAFLFLRLNDATLAPDFMLGAILRGVSIANGPDSKIALAAPYYDAASVFSHQLGQNKLKEDFSGACYSLEAFWCLLVRANLKQTAKGLWPAVSRIDFRSFVPTPTWRSAQWRAPEGKNVCEQQPLTVHWADLEARAYSSTRETELMFANRYGELMSFLCVYPHRFNAEVVRAICDAFGYGWKVKRKEAD